MYLNDALRVIPSIRMLPKSTNASILPLLVMPTGAHCGDACAKLPMRRSAIMIVIRISLTSIHRYPFCGAILPVKYLEESLRVILRSLSGGPGFLIVKDC